MVFDSDKNKLKLIGFLTREEVRKAAEILSAPVNREDSHTCSKYCGEWIDLLYPVSYWVLNKFRIKSEPKYRPFKDAKECFEEMKKHEPFGWIRNICNDCYMNVDRIGQFNLGNNQKYWGFGMAFHEFQFPDGTPFGIKEG